MNFKLTLQSLQAYLEKLQYKVQLQDNQLYTVKRQENIDLVLFFRILNDGELLQILVGLPFPLKEELFNDVGRVLHKLNLDLDMPGFGMDENTKLIFYRSVIPCQNKMCDPALFEKYLELGPRACSSFAQIIAVIAQGHMTYDELIKRSLST